MKKVLPSSFFNRDTSLVAKELLGTFLVRRVASKKIEAMITQAEVYDGPYDLASHASKGKTKRTNVMFGESGRYYIYLCYGVHEMLNIVTREQGYPAAILIRGVLTGNIHINGPGKVTKFFGIDRALHGKKATTSEGLWFEDRGIGVNLKKIKKSARVGVDYAGPVWAQKKLRFTLEN